MRMMIAIMALALAGCNSAPATTNGVEQTDRKTVSYKLNEMGVTVEAEVPFGHRDFQIGLYSICRNGDMIYMIEGSRTQALSVVAKHEKCATSE